MFLNKQISINPRLATRKQEMEEIIHDMEARIEEEEEKVIKSAEDKKKLQQHIQVTTSYAHTCITLFYF